jgi:signal transduction histidine kinase
MSSLPRDPRGLATFVHSIRFRLTLWFVLILAIVLATFSGLIYVTQSRSLRSDVARRLREQSIQAQAALAESEIEHENQGPAPINPLTGDRLSTQEVLILTDAQGSISGAWGRKVEHPEQVVGRLLAPGSSDDQPAFVQNLRAQDANGETSAGDFAFARTPIERGGQVAGYLIYGRESDVAEQERRLAVSLVIGNIMMLALAFLGGVWIADRAMRPVAAIAQAARGIGETDLGRRLNLPGRDELADLAATFDDMLRRLQAAFERQRRFVADSSHELRTPLAIINLEAGRALEGQRSADEYRLSLHVIDTEGRRMGRLVNDLMVLARMDAGQSVMEFQALDLRQLAGEAVERLASLARQGDVRLTSGSMPPAPMLGDRQYLMQAISNLVENGIKYCGAGREVRVELALHGGKAVMRVSDTGPGIPPEHVPLLFDRFYQVDAARSQKDEDAASPQGSGLGLSIARSIIQAHHGEIHVNSELNRGTTFEVILPLRTG